LLAHYHGANLRARSAPAPFHFWQRWTLARPEVGVTDGGDYATSPFPDTEVDRVLARLAATRREVLTSYSEAQLQYASIAEVVLGQDERVMSNPPESVASQ